MDNRFEFSRLCNLLAKVAGLMSKSSIALKIWSKFEIPVPLTLVVNALLR
jgi:hypothetical protein